MIIPEDLADRLRAIAERENRSPEDALRSAVNMYDRMGSPNEERAYYSPQRVRERLYARARRYWQETGNTERLNLTDEQLDEQLWLFDEQGIPRLKSEQEAVQLSDNSLQRLAQLAEEADLQLSALTDAENLDDVLNDEFADYLLKRMGNNGSP
jgi:predicted transcriptional regulator